MVSVPLVFVVTLPPDFAPTVFVFGRQSNLHPRRVLFLRTSLRLLVGPSLMWEARANRLTDTPIQGQSLHARGKQPPSTLALQMRDVSSDQGVRWGHKPQCALYSRNLSMDTAGGMGHF